MLLGSINPWFKACQIVQAAINGVFQFLSRLTNPSINIPSNSADLKQSKTDHMTEVQKIRFFAGENPLQIRLPKVEESRVDELSLADGRFLYACLQS
jgi:hypothetical protein